MRATYAGWVTMTRRAALLAAALASGDVRDNAERTAGNPGTRSPTELGLALLT